MGLDLGIDSTGQFELLACVEKEPTFCETIRKNRDAGRLPKNLRVYEGDICELSPELVMQECGLKLGELDLLVGGPPCQSFSTAGKRGTIQDPRGMLIWQFLKFVEVLQPKFFVMENVRGLISAALKHRPIAERPEKGGQPLSEDESPGSVIRLLANDLQMCGTAAYHMDCFEVNAVNYGAPQLRERVIFIGNRFNKRVEFPDPTHGRDEPHLKPWRTLRDAIGGINDPGTVILDFSPRKKRYLSLVPAGSNWRSLPVDIQKESMGRAWHAKGGRSGWWRRLSFDLPCPTLVTMPNHASTALCHPIEVRALSLKEYARIQEFPENWEFCGTPMQQYAQAGNAVPIRLGRITGDVVANALDALKARKWRKEPSSIEDYRIVYIQSHVRTRQWFKNGVTKVWEDGKTNKAVEYGSPVTKRSERTLMENKMAGHSDLPKAIPAVLLDKEDIFRRLKKIDTDKNARDRILNMESEFRKKIDTHIEGLPDSKSEFSKFYTSPFVLMFYSKQKNYSYVSQIEKDIVPAKVFSSMETSAGNMIEKLVLPIYGWEYVESSMGTYKSLLDGKKIEQSKSRLVVATLKSGPRTLNDGMVDNIASEIVGSAHDWAIEFGVKEVDFTYGSLYGTKRQSNKKDWHILRKISEKRSRSTKEIVSHVGNWSTSYTTGALTVSATIRNGIEWWEFLGGENTWIELCSALIRACISPAKLPDKTPEYMIADLPEILDMSMIDDSYNVSILQKSQLEWLLFLARHFSDGFKVVKGSGKKH